jgi:hypothetical protein
MEWAPCTKLFLKWFLWTYMMLGSTTNSNNRWEILKCPPPPTPLYEFVYGFGQIDWDAKIPSTSHVVLMTSHLNGLETFPIFPKNIWWVYVKVTNSQRMGIGTWGWDNPCQRDAFGLHLKGFLLGNLQNIHTNVACVARKPKCEQDPNDGAHLWKNYLKFWMTFQWQKKHSKFNIFHILDLKISKSPSLNPTH